jgi:hypothetical protein
VTNSESLAVPPGDQSWEVRPSVLIGAEVEPHHLRTVEAEIRRVLPGAQITASLAVGPKGGKALGATLLLTARTVGAAADLGLDLLLHACRKAGLATHGLHEVTVEASGRDPRDW